MITRWWKWPLCQLIGHDWHDWRGLWDTCDRCGRKALLPDPFFDRVKAGFIWAVLVVAAVTVIAHGANHE